MLLALVTAGRAAAASGLSLRLAGGPEQHALAVELRAGPGTAEILARACPAGAPCSPEGGQRFTVAADAASQIVDADKVPAGWRIMDIGPKSIALFS
ncbi:MAG: hypothetical protein HY744_00420, partial [Deltaproteobacteria bacterium]|nr:hypothetical protein [Deltaproteobacteria bacterium]